MNSKEDETTQKLQILEPAFLTRIRLRAQRRILWLRACWSSHPSDGMQGLAISHSEVDRILVDLEQHMAAESTFYARDTHAHQLSKRIDTVERTFANGERWIRLTEAFSLSAEEIDLLTLTVAVEVDPSLRRVYGYIQDDANASFPTLWLAASLFQWSSIIHFGPAWPLVHWRMAWPLEGLANPWSVIAPWIADPYIVSWLTQGDAGQDPTLDIAVQLIRPSQITEEMSLYPAQLHAMQAFVEAIRSVEDASTAGIMPIPIEVELIGPRGAGKRTLTEQFCRQQGRNMLIADASLLLDSGVSLSLQIERLRRTARTARLTRAILYWHNLEGVDHRVWNMVQGCSDLEILGTLSPIALVRNGAAKKSFRLPLLTRSLRIALWQHLSDAPIPHQITDWVLTPAEIANAAKVAPAGNEAMVEACRHVLHQGGPQELFTPLPCPFTWDDIILSPTVRQHLTELEDQARLRWLIYEEWGFERLFALGQGVTALFAGPSGTGKTMAAQVLARSLGMDLYRVDLAGVMSKYIGETEKRLKLIFDTCERANVLLFFDEADALFGQRTQVKDAHDRFANIEIDYLLQRMEQFDGIAVLATNRKGDMDTAFLRRLRFIIDFVPPGPAERLTLWQLALPRQAPNGEELLDDIDWDFLATKLNMTGADIKAAALGAAFLARTAGTRITMKQVLYVARREMAKQGINLRLGAKES